jgi:glycerol-3-phosphate dehydrogenase
VRPLLDDESGDPSAVTRDYLLELDTDQAPLLSVWGGKITTFRKLAEEAADGLSALLHAPRGTWTRGAFLPGGDLSGWIGAPQRPDTDIQRFVQVLSLRHPELSAPLARRLARDYGSRVEALLSGGLGDEIAPGLHEAELDYLHRHEWARTADDVLWRRTKLGLHLGDEQRADVAQWCVTHWHGDTAAAVSARSAPASHRPPSEIAWN